MTSEEYEDILYNHRILRWAARILGTIEVLFLFYIAFTEFWEEIDGKSPTPLITMINGQYFLTITLTIAFIGLIIAYWKEGIGGGISLASYIVLFIGWSDFHLNFIFGMLLAALPGILYFAYGLKVHLDIKRAERSQTNDQ